MQIRDDIELKGQMQDIGEVADPDLLLPDPDLLLSDPDLVKSPDPDPTLKCLLSF